MHNYFYWLQNASAACFQQFVEVPAKVDPWVAPILWNALQRYLQMTDDIQLKIQLIIFMHFPNITFILTMELINSQEQ